jgi:autotransporter-associated beta strand protein
MMNWFRQIVACAVMLVFCTAVRPASAATATIDTGFDRWMYPFAFSGGTRDLAPTFGAVGNEGFDNRDGQFILGFNTSDDIAAGLGAGRYQINSLTVRAMVGSPSGFVYDPTYDSFRTYLPEGDSRRLADSDDGRPVELHGVGFRNGYTQLSFGPTNNQPPQFEESAPFGPAAAGTRNVFPLGFLTPGVDADISNNVDLGVESQPWAIATANLTPGDGAPNNTVFSFDVDLSNDDVVDYLRHGLDSGVLGFAITSLHEAAQTGGPPVPQFITKENSRVGSLPAVLEIEYTILSEPSPEKVWSNDADGQVSVSINWTGGIAPTTEGDSVAFLNAITSQRTVEVDVPLTLAKVRFDSGHSYTLEGPQAITLSATGDDAALRVDNAHGNGQHTISGRLVVGDTLSIVQHSQQSLVISGPFENSAGHAITKTGAGLLVLSGDQTHGFGGSLVIGEGQVLMNSDAGSSAVRNLTIAANSDLIFGSIQHLAALSIGAAGKVRMTAGGTKSIVTGALSIAGDAAPTGALDIAEGALVLDYAAAGPNPQAAIRQHILVGRGGAGLGATWTGKGITSSAAADAVAVEPESVSLAYAVNGDLPLGPIAVFGGEAVDSSSVLVRYTRTGDANLDGVVNDDDVTIVGAAYAPGITQPHWALGDFDYNGFVDDDDVTLLGVFYNPLAAPLAGSPPVTGAPVPEPATICLLILAAALLVAWRCRRGTVLLKLWGNAFPQPAE